jgi:hypothetical protein
MRHSSLDCMSPKKTSALSQPAAKKRKAMAAATPAEAPPPKVLRRMQPGHMRHGSVSKDVPAGTKPAAALDAQPHLSTCPSSRWSTGLPSAASSAPRERRCWVKTHTLHDPKRIARVGKCAFLDMLYMPFATNSCKRPHNQRRKTHTSFAGSAYREFSSQNLTYDLGYSVPST